MPRAAPCTARSSRQSLEQRAREVLDRLEVVFPEAQTALRHDDPFQLLVATVLSAQCTDRLVNQVTPELFAILPTPAAMAGATAGTVEEMIRPVNYYKTKARRLRQIGAALVERHGGLVPSTLAELVSLPGVGRKTANVVLGAGFGKVEGLVVDTHVLRVARRLGLHTAADPLQAEQELMALLPRERWIAASHRLIFHGRRACLARRPRCLDCVLADLCPSAAPGAAEARRGSGSTGAVDGRTAPPEEERR